MIAYVLISIFFFLVVGFIALLLSKDIEIVICAIAGLIGVLIFLASQILSELDTVNKKLDNLKKDDDKKDITQQ